MHSSVSGVYFLVSGRTISKLKKAAHKNSQLALSLVSSEGESSLQCEQTHVNSIHLLIAGQVNTHSLLVWTGTVDIDLNWYQVRGIVPGDPIPLTDQQKDQKMSAAETNWQSFLAPDSDLPPDVFFLVNDEENRGGSPTIGAHKFILAGVSPVFRGMFYGPLKEEREVVEVKETTYKAFDTLSGEGNSEAPLAL